MNFKNYFNVVLLLGILVYAAYVSIYYLTHNYQLPRIYLGEEVTKEGIVYRQRVSWQGRGLYQGVSYIFEHDSIWYTGRSRLGKREGSQQVGDIIEVVYTKNKPGNSNQTSKSYKQWIQDDNEIRSNQEGELRKMILSENLVVYYPSLVDEQYATPYLAAVQRTSDTSYVLSWLPVFYYKDMERHIPLGHTEKDTLVPYKLGWRFAKEKYGFQ